MVQLAVQPAENRTDTRNCGTEPYQEAIVLTKMTIKTKTFVKNHKGLDLDSHQFDHSRLFHPANATDAEPPGQTPPIISPRKKYTWGFLPSEDPLSPPNDLEQNRFFTSGSKIFQLLQPPVKDWPDTRLIQFKKQTTFTIDPSRHSLFWWVSCGKWTFIINGSIVTVWLIC